MNRDEWIEKIRQAVSDMNQEQDKINKAIDDFVVRVQACYKANGGHFEMKKHKSRNQN